MGSESSNIYDVAVIGGGVAGVCAAVQAGRIGGKVLLVEATSCLAGTVVNSGIAHPGLFHAWQKQVIAGIGWELVEKCLDEARMPMPDWRNPNVIWWQLQIFIDPSLFSALCDEAVIAAGVDLRFHTMLGAMERRNEGGWKLTLCDKDGLKSVEAMRVIDCTGDATAARLAGAEIVKSPVCQPATASFKMSGYDDSKIDKDALNAALVRAIQDGELRAEDACWKTDQPQAWQTVWKHGYNSNHIPATAECATAQGRTALEIEGRAAIRRFIRWLRKQPGFEKLRLDYVYPEVGIRESVTVRGLATVTREEYCAGKLVPEAICYSFYPIDAHGIRSTDWETENLKPGVVATIPRGATIVAGVPDLLIAGRILSSDHLANSALRTQPTCMATGQAAGALAVLSARKDCAPQDVSMTELAEILETNGAIVPPASIS